MTMYNNTTIGWKFLALILTMFFAGCGNENRGVPDRGYYSDTPVTRWEDGMVSGNGVTGALVYGNPGRDTVILSGWDLYMPLNEPLLPVNMGEHLDTIREMMLAGLYGDASEFVVRLSREEGYGSKRWTDPFVPGFDLLIGHAGSGSPENYRRRVDFTTGEIIVSWDDDRGSWERKLFVSRADSVVVIQIRNLTGRVDCSVQLDRRPLVFRGYFDRGFAAGDYAVDSGEGVVSYSATYRNSWEGSLKGCEGVAVIKSPGGNSERMENGLQLTGAREVTILAALNGTHGVPGEGIEAMTGRLRSINWNYDRLLKRHVAIHNAIFSRMSLQLAGDQANEPVDRLLEENRQEPVFALIEKQFDAGRYNILSSTGINPPNLQGIWAGSWASDWSGDYTQNGNLQVAMASMMSGNMPELMSAYFDYQERMLNDSRVNAQRLFGARGIHIASRTSSHGLNNHFDRIWPMTFWTAGAGWASNFYYDYWLYTGDATFLKEKAFPFMREAALFYEDFLIEGDNGRYLFVPSYSPENNPSNSEWQACINATMDVMVAKQLLRNCISAARATGDTTDVEKWKAMLKKMPEYEVNSDGALREWLWPRVEENYAHRHASHLYGLFDIIDPEIGDSELLTEAARVAVGKRMEVRRKEDGGIMAFGMVQLALAAAALGEGDMAWECVRWLSLNYWSPSLVTTHDPRHIFNLDLSGGFPALIIRMLAYSEPGYISLLPALPPVWERGSIEGLLMRGGITVNRLEWSKDSVNVSMVSKGTQEIVLELPDGMKATDGLLQVEAIPGTENRRFKAELKAGREVVISFVPI
jgi:alpha-L-fucosidase 2